MQTVANKQLGDVSDVSDVCFLFIHARTRAPEYVNLGENNVTNVTNVTRPRWHG